VQIILKNAALTYKNLKTRMYSDTWKDKRANWQALTGINLVELAQ